MSKKNEVKSAVTKEPPSGKHNKSQKKKKGITNQAMARIEANVDHFEKILRKHEESNKYDMEALKELGILGEKIYSQMKMVDSILNIENEEK